jgi:hypothetical protein
MRVKVYKVYNKYNPDIWYLVDAPNKRIAKWCGAAIFCNTYCANLWTEKDMIAERRKEEE